MMRLEPDHPPRRLPRVMVDQPVLLRELAHTVLALSRRVAALETALEADRAARLRQSQRLGRRLAKVKVSVSVKVTLSAEDRALGARLIGALPVEVWEIVQQEAAAVGVPEVAVMSRCRNRTVTRARSAAMVRALALPLSLSEVGRLFDRNHATVSSARDAAVAAGPFGREAAA